MIRSIVALSVVVFFTILRPEAARTQDREEFVGPFASWANVRTGFGAAGNGKNDDTKALQNAIDGLGNIVVANKTGKKIYSVVYIPAGTYCISSTLVLRGKIGVSIIGEDPDRTIIKWIGGNKDTLLWANGSAYFKISRLTWDANGRKDLEGIGIHWKSKWNDSESSSHAPLNIDISDNYFIGGFAKGIGGGTFAGPSGTGNNDSEIAIRRCIFRDCGMAGIQIEGFNALDYWIWDCQFLHCRTGVTCSFGNYHVYRSFFSGSTLSDVHNSNGHYTSVRGCYSENATQFSLDDGSSSNPLKRIFQDNIVINPKLIPIEYYHVGKITLLGNKFSRSSDTAIQCSLNTKTWSGYVAEVLSLNNTYGGRKPVQIGSNPNKLYQSHDLINTSVTGNAAAFLQTMDRKPKLVKRKVFDVPAGANGDIIQAILNEAAHLKGQRPVVHFATGNYIVGRTLMIPSGSDMQLQGDGLIYASAIRADNPATFGQRPLLWVKGPSYIVIKDIQIGIESDKGQHAGILFEGLDQPGAQAHLDQVYSSHTDTSLLVIGMDNLYVQKDNSFFTTGNYITGGKSALTGKSAARVCCFGGQFARLTVKNNARFLAKDCWWEGGDRIPLYLEGAGSVTVDGAMIAPNHADSLPTVRIGQFAGNISLLNMYLQGAVDCEANNPHLNILLWNILFYHKMDPLAFLRRGVNYRGAGLGLNAQCFRPNDPACTNITSLKDEWQNITDINSFLEDQTAPTRSSTPVLYGNLRSGTSNIYLSRISFGAMDRGIEFK